MPQLFISGKNIYSVDMMHAYLDLFKPLKTKIKIEDLTHLLNANKWGNNYKNKPISARDVIQNPNKKKYKSHINRIKSSDLKYPIIIYNNDVIDGVHRLTKAYLEEKKNIWAYIFPKNIFDKFLISNVGKKKAYEMDIADIIKLFYKRFCKTKI